ncbi:MAG TPA: radical SAM protein [Candidatus Methylomirabilis sp.]|nr:radical SAM protein [Candidatus Methylomirabilis sp.]
MSWHFKERARKRLAGETGTVTKDWGGRLRIALVFPNTYYVGMSNLGFQTIYWHLNQRPDIVCERAFYPDPEDLPEHARLNVPILSLESQRPLADFDCVAFSTTYENDYLNLLQILHLSGIPVRAADRGPADPLVSMGGVCAWSNPEPLATFVDFFFLGEGEESSHEVFELWQRIREAGRDPDAAREQFLRSICQIEGIYVPRFYDVKYHEDGTVAEVVPHERAPLPVRKRRLARTDDYDTLSMLRTADTEFGEMALLEVGKGCGRGCRFCMEGEIYRPVRHRHLEAILRAADTALRRGQRIGLVGACVSDYPWIDNLIAALRAKGVEVSLSSVRADSLTPGLVQGLVESGSRTLTIAPEAGTERLRRVIHKEISDQRLFEAADLIAASGVPSVKTYFMIGQPTETAEDVEGIIRLVKTVRHRILQKRRDPKSLVELTVGVSCFVPKPWTAFQWSAMAEVRELDEKIQHLKRELRRVGIRFTHDVPRWAYLQGVLSRGDRHVGDLLSLALQQRRDWRRAFREWPRNPDFYASRERPLTERFPWDHFEVGTKRDRLGVEYQRAMGQVPERPVKWKASLA